MDKQKWNGVLYVLTGAISYGVLATIVKYANGLGIHTSALTFYQFFIGFLILTVINFLVKKEKKATTISKVKLILWGTSLGLTTTLYYLSIQYIPVSVGIILLMQSIWMSLVLEIIIKKKKPTMKKVIGALICILGTLFATDIFNSQTQLDWKGLLFGFGAGLSYTISMYSSSTIEKQYSNYTRSLFLVLGGMIFITLFWNFQIIEHLSSQSLYWGIVLALFGTVIPPLLFTAGIPKIGIGAGSIISSIEIPVSILSAYLILQENISPMQWFGVFLIILAVIIVNLSKKLTVQ